MSNWASWAYISHGSKLKEDKFAATATHAQVKSRHRLIVILVLPGNYQQGSVGDDKAWKGTTDGHVESMMVDPLKNHPA